LPDAEFGFVTARLDTVIRRNGFVLEPVLWQIVIFVGGVFVGDGVADADGQAPVPITIASPVCMRCALNTRPELEFGLVTALLDTVIRRNGLVLEPVL
jgi:hypothetical protein